jgi:putative ABC transport system ATP-binding protein
MLIRAEKLGKSYTKKGRSGRIVRALQETDISLESGKLTVIFGRSGSGKTTLVNILSGLVRPTEGSVFYGDKNIFSMNDGELSRFRIKNIGYIPQGQSALSVLTVVENVLLPASLIGKDSAAEAERLLEIVGLTELRNAYPNELSGGELRRLAVARALINKPAVIFADEPTNDLDDGNTRLVLDLLKKTAADGAAVVVVTHEQSAAAFADVICRMDGGVLTEEKGCKRDIA